MARIRRKFSAQFKRRVVASVRAGIRVAAIAKDFGLGQTCIYRWMKRFRARGVEPFTCYQPKPLLTPIATAIGPMPPPPPAKPTNEDVGRAVCLALDAMENVIRVLGDRKRS